MKPAIDAVIESGKVAEAAVCYTGDILDKNKTKYDLATTSGWQKSLKMRGLTF